MQPPQWFKIGCLLLHGVLCGHTAAQSGATGRFYSSPVSLESRPDGRIGRFSGLSTAGGRLFASLDDGSGLLRTSGALSAGTQTVILPISGAVKTSEVAGVPVLAQPGRLFLAPNTLSTIQNFHQGPFQDPIIMGNRLVCKGGHIVSAALNTAGDAMAVESMHTGPPWFSSRPNLALWNGMIFGVASGVGSTERVHVLEGIGAGPLTPRELPVPNFGASGATTPEPLVPTPAGVYFVGQDKKNGRELWITDGSVAGTRLVKDIRSGIGDSAPALLTAAASGLYFTADDGTHGREVWFTDGTEAGTVMVGDLKEGPESSNPQQLTALGTEILFLSGPPNVYPAWSRTLRGYGIQNFSPPFGTVALGSNVKPPPILESPTAARHIIFNQWANPRGTLHLATVRPGVAGYEDVVLGDYRSMALVGETLFTLSEVSPGITAVSCKLPGSSAFQICEFLQGTAPRDLTLLRDGLYFLLDKAERTEIRKIHLCDGLSFRQWAACHDLPDADPTVSYSADGVPALLKYAFNDPVHAAPLLMGETPRQSFPLVSRRRPSGIHVEIRQRHNAALTYKVEVSGDLRRWYHVTQPPTVLASDPGWETVRYSGHLEFSGKGYARVTVLLAP